MDPNTSTDQSDSDRSTSVRARFVRIMLFVAVLLFLSTLASLYWSWWTIEEPSSSIVVSGNPALDGVQVIVDGLRLNQPLEVTMSQENGHNARFFVQPGTYDVVLVLPDGRRFSQRVPVESGKVSVFALQHWTPSAQNPAGSGGGEPSSASPSRNNPSSGDSGSTPRR